MESRLGYYLEVFVNDFGQFTYFGCLFVEFSALGVVEIPIFDVAHVASQPLDRLNGARILLQHECGHIQHLVFFEYGDAFRWIGR